MHYQIVVIESRREAGTKTGSEAGFAACVCMNSEWTAVLQALHELYLECEKTFRNICKQGYLFPYNIILAK